MQNPTITRQLWRLANRMARNAEALREARLPHHMTKHKSRALRHLKELNKIRDFWADGHIATRRPKPPPRLLCRCQESTIWQHRRSAR